MIYRSDEEPHIGVQKFNLNYFFLHWEYSDGLAAIGSSLKSYEYEPIGPTILVEWLE